VPPYRPQCLAGIFAEKQTPVSTLELMKFTLIYDGPLPAGKNKRALYAAGIRNKLHPQMRDLWDHHIVLRELAHTARTFPLMGGGYYGGAALGFSLAELPTYDKPPSALLPGQTDLCAPISVPNVGEFLPIVRRSLYLACAIDILFLRHENADQLLEGGDLDNRIKCFFDALTIPNREQAKAGEAPHARPLCCLLENDRLISDFSIRTAGLWGKEEAHKYDVRIQADITIKVLRVSPQNQCLIGD
jgi:hypothetical protein